MAFELTKEFLAAIEDAIGQADKSRIRELTESLHPADIAEIVEELDVQEAKFLYQSLEKELAAEVIIEMDEAEKEDFLDQFTSREIAEDVIDNAAMLAGLESRPQQRTDRGHRSGLARWHQATTGGVGAGAVASIAVALVIA